MNEHRITLTAADGFQLEAFCVTPDTSKGGLVILQEIFGVTGHLQSVARDFAARGLAVIVPAMFDRIAPHTVIPYSDAPRGLAIMQRLDVEQVMLDVEAAIKALDTDKVCVMGYCWGGGIAVRAAGRFDLTGAVAYYGTRLQQHLVNGVKCPILFHFGETDSHSPPEVIDLVRQAVPDAEIHLYAAGHAFANHERPTYVADAAALANERSLAFLDRLCSG